MIKRLLFKTTHENSIFNEGSMTLLRVAAGILMAGLHGMGKVPPSEQLIGGVTGLGFPAPVLFAWAAGLSELLGGIFLAIGFLTRPSAILLAITMLTAAFGVHMADPWSVKELSFLYLVIATVFAVRGAGRWSFDNLIKK